MNIKKQTEIRIDIATRAIVVDLERYKEKNPGGHLPSRDLFKHAAKRSGWIMDDEYDAAYDLEAIPPPTPGFIRTHWRMIKRLAARKHKKFIVFEPWEGFRLGTFEEYQATRQRMARIASGVGDSIDEISEVVIHLGGEPYSIEVKVKQLTAGDDQDDEE